MRLKEKKILLYKLKKVEEYNLLQHSFQWPIISEIICLTCAFLKSEYVRTCFLCKVDEIKK